MPLRYFPVLFVLALVHMTLRAQTPAQTFVVNSTNDRIDASPGDGKCDTGNLVNGTTPECTLRAALDEVNALSTGTSSFYAVTLPAGQYQISISETCPFQLLDSSSVNITSKAFCLTGNLILNGANPTTTIIDGAKLDRIFLSSHKTVSTISNVTLQNGAASQSLCCYRSTDNGGSGIENEGTLTLSNDIVTQNAAEGVYNAGTLTVIGTTFLNNSGISGGGGSAIQTIGPVSIDSSYFTSNIGDSVIGAFNVNTGTFYTSSPVAISNSTFTANTSQGPTISLYDVSTIVNSVIAFNSNGAGAVKSPGYYKETINNSTIYGNTGNTGGVAIDGGANGVAMIVSNTIASNNGGQYACAGAVTDGGHNLFGTGCTATDATSRVGVDPLLGTLAVNGGTIPTLTPLSGSPARGTGSTAVPGSGSAGACAALDERGFVRKLPCTIGAVDPNAADPSAGFQVISVLPSVGAAGGSSVVTVLGTGFLPGTTLALKNNQGTIQASQIVVGADAYSIGATFDLTNATVGRYDLVGVSPGGVTNTLAASFTATAPAAPILTGNLVGPGVLRPSRPTRLDFYFQNTGNEDAFLVPLSIRAPGDVAVAVASKVAPPPVASGQTISDFSSVPTLIAPVYSDSAHLNVSNYLIPVIPAYSTGVFSIQVTLPNSYTEGQQFILDVHLSDPYVTGVSGTPDATDVSQYVLGAVSYAQSQTGTTLAQSIVDRMTSYATGQISSIVAAGRSELLQSHAGPPALLAETEAQTSSAVNQPTFYSDAQLSVDIAAFGANLDSGGNTKFSFRGAGARPLYIIDHNKFMECQAKSQFGWTIEVDSNGDNPTCTPPNGCSIGAPSGGGGSCNPFSIVRSADPNDKNGPPGVGSAHYTQADTAFPYAIEFENMATANAPAQTVSVTDPIDSGKFDLSSFQLGSIDFGAYQLTPPPGSTSFAGAIDLRPSQNLIVSVVAGLDKTSGTATWNFTSLDPATVQLTTDPTAGFLPPDTTPPAGIGHVRFTINPLASVADAATLCNTASVVFDTNAALSTPTYCNTKDISPPVSMVQPLPSTEPSTSFRVSWSGTDTGSGVGSYSVFVSDNGGAYSTWQTATAAISASYTGVAGHTYSFYSIAVDLVGNVEAAKTRAEATTTVSLAPAATFNPTSIAFGSVAVGGTASAMVTVTSTGGNPLAITGFTLSDTTDFSQTNTCTGALNTGQSCTVTVSFSPTSAASSSGATTATLALVGNAASAPAPIALSGFAGQSGLQNVWVVNGNRTLSKLSNAGAAVSPTAGYIGGGAGIAIDNAGNVWSGTPGGTSVVEFSKSGTLSGTFTGGGIASPVALAVSGGYVWIANANSTVSLMQSNGTAVSPAGGFTGGELNAPSAVAIDGSGNLWIANSGDSSLTEFLGATDPVVAPLAVAAKNATQGAKP